MEDIDEHYQQQVDESEQTQDEWEIQSHGQKVIHSLQRNEENQENSMINSMHFTDCGTEGNRSEDQIPLAFPQDSSFSDEDCDSSNDTCDRLRQMVLDKMRKNRKRIFQNKAKPPIKRRKIERQTDSDLECSSDTEFEQWIYLEEVLSDCELIRNLSVANEIISILANWASGHLVECEDCDKEGHLDSTWDITWWWVSYRDPWGWKCRDCHERRMLDPSKTTRRYRAKRVQFSSDEDSEEREQVVRSKLKIVIRNN